MWWPKGKARSTRRKVDVHVRDAIGRRWQLFTVQVDFQEPQRFGLSYTGADNQQHRAVHDPPGPVRVDERFFGILVEHYAGAFPTWLSPVQAAILPVAERHEDYAAKVLAELAVAGLRADVREASDTLGNRIRLAQEEKVPYMLVVGDRDVEAGTLGVRSRSGDDRRDVAWLTSWPTSPPR